MDNKIYMNILKAISRERNKIRMISDNLNIYVDMYLWTNEFKINRPRSIEICETKIIGANVIHNHKYYEKKYYTKKGEIIMNLVELDMIKVLGDKEKFYYEGGLLLYEKLNAAIGHNTLSYNFNIGLVRCTVIKPRKYISMEIFDRKHLLNKKYRLKSRIRRIPNSLMEVNI